MGRGGEWGSIHRLRQMHCTASKAFQSALFKHFVCVYVCAYLLCDDRSFQFVFVKSVFVHIRVCMCVCVCVCVCVWVCVYVRALVFSVNFTLEPTSFDCMVDSRQWTMRGSGPPREYSLHLENGRTISLQHPFSHRHFREGRVECCPDFYP